MVAGQVLRDGNVKESKTNHTERKLKLIMKRKKKGLKVPWKWVRQTLGFLLIEPRQ